MPSVNQNAAQHSALENARAYIQICLRAQGGVRIEIADSISVEADRSNIEAVMQSAKNAAVDAIQTGLSATATDAPREEKLFPEEAKLVADAMAKLAGDGVEPRRLQQMRQTLTSELLALRAVTASSATLRRTGCGCEAAVIQAAKDAAIADIKSMMSRGGWPRVYA